jgi:NADP-dependent 3-hydroxy acid dehydrogenase YdfG
MKSPKDKVAFVTGGASGIGLALGRVLLSAGMKVVLADIRKDPLFGLADEFEGLPVHLIPLDVSDRRAMEQAAAETESVFGKVHLLCNNAGVNLFGPLDESIYSDWDWVLDVNLNGVINGIVTFLPRMKAHGEGGHILNTASIAAFLGSTKAGIYAASKAAVCSLSESLWYDLSPHRIGVSILCPGLVKSQIYQSNDARPGRCLPSGYTESDDLTASLKEVHSHGMDPTEVAQKALQGILRNDLYIFTHPEHRDEFVERFNRLGAAFPNEPVDPNRLAFEEGRRQRQQDLWRRGQERLGTE